MAGWKFHKGQAAGLPLENVDTDQLVPARFMSTPRSQGYGGFLLYDLRYDETGKLRVDIPFNSLAGASILIARRNFGGGSSREAAVYALVDAGFHIVIAPSFGDIFVSNAINNGLLPAQVTETEADTLIAAAPLSLSIDVLSQSISAEGYEFKFKLDPALCTKLVNGWDDVDLAASYEKKIRAFKKNRQLEAPWLWTSTP
jgi:3-isopropylmalate/(R)-2-methylmalate dehydratase small subunit